MNPQTQLKNLAPFLDPHLLLLLLRKNVGEESADLQKQIEAKLLGADAEKAKQTEAESEKKAKNLLSLLENNQECQRLRKEVNFTLDKLGQSEHKITIEDCQALFDHAKVKYELRKYVQAEKYLFNLKEILINATYQHSKLVAQVFWGLLACEIQNEKSRESTELTTIRKLKDILRSRYSELPMQMLHQTQWLLHWSLVFSFTSERSNGLFAALLADWTNFGETYVNVVALSNQPLMRHMVAAFLLGRSQYQPPPQPQSSKFQITPLDRDALPKIALPMILSEKSVYSDSFTQFTEALFEEFDFEKACELADALEKEAQSDILLKPHAKELRRAALLYVFEVQSRLYKQGNDLEAFCKEHNVEYVDVAVAEVQDNMARLGLIVQTDGDMGTQISIEGNQYDVKGKIHTKTMELMKRTEDLNRAYTNQVQNLVQMRAVTQQQEAEESKKRGT